MKSIFLITLFALVAACDGPPKPKDAEVDHSKMGHGPNSLSNRIESVKDRSTMESSPGAAEQPYDLQFIDTMILHHQGAVDMAILVQTRSRQPELTPLAKSIIDEQTKEIARMRKWRNEWFAGKPAALNIDLAGMRDGMKGMDAAQLDPLKDRAFDLEFVRQMIPHHEGAVLMAKEAVQKSENAEIKELAESIIRSQEAEIKKMREWQTAWTR